MKLYKNMTKNSARVNFMTVWQSARCQSHTTVGLSSFTIVPLGTGRVRRMNYPHYRLALHWKYLTRVPQI